MPCKLGRTPAPKSFYLLSGYDASGTAFLKRDRDITMCAFFDGEENCLTFEVRIQSLGLVSGKAHFGQRTDQCANPT